MIRLGAVQAAPVWLDRAATASRACGIIEQAGRDGANLIAFPENFIPGHPSWYYFHPASGEVSRQFAARLFEQSVVVPSDATEALCAAAASAGVNVVVGVTAKRGETTGTLYNCQLFIDASGRLPATHEKLVATATERLVHGPGHRETQRSFRAEFGTVSSLICGENSNPLAVARVAAEYPVVHVASWPNNFSQGSAGMRACSLLASRSVAYSCGCFVVLSASTNSDEMVRALAASADDEAFMRDPDKTGGSAIINPVGEVIAGPLPGEEEGIVYADVDLGDCIRARGVHDFAGHYNRADVYQLSVNTEPSELVTIAAPTGPNEDQRTGTNAAGPAAAHMPSHDAVRT